MHYYSTGTYILIQGKLNALLTTRNIPRNVFNSCDFSWVGGPAIPAVTLCHFSIPGTQPIYLRVCHAELNFFLLTPERRCRRCLLKVPVAAIVGIYRNRNGKK